MKEKDIATHFISMTARILEKPSEPSLDEVHGRLVFWKSASLFAGWFNQITFVLYSAALLGYLQVPFWLWIIWSAFILSHLSGFTVWLNLIGTSNQYETAYNKSKQTEAVLNEEPK